MPDGAPKSGDFRELADFPGFEVVAGAADSSNRKSNDGGRAAIKSETLFELCFDFGAGPLAEPAKEPAKEPADEPADDKRPFACSRELISMAEKENDSSESFSGSSGFTLR